MALALMQSKLTRLNVDCQLITALVGVDIDDIAAVHLAQAAHSDWVAACIALHAPSTRRESTTPRAVNRLRGLTECAAAWLTHPDPQFGVPLQRHLICEHTLAAGGNLG